jgi:hypothetical protein
MLPHRRPFTAAAPRPWHRPVAVRDKRPRLTYSLIISNFPWFAKLKR